MEETRRLIKRVLFFFYEGYQPTPQRIDEFAAGWIAEEALASGIWCALTLQGFPVTSPLNGLLSQECRSVWDLLKLLQ
jgi:hypothetical protein